MYVEPRNMVQMNRVAGQNLRHRCREQKKEPKPKQSLSEFTLHNCLGNHEILGNRFAYLSLSSGRIAEYCHVL